MLPAPARPLAPAQPAAAPAPAMMSFGGADALLGAPFAPLHGGGSLHYALGRKAGTGGPRSAAGSSSGFHSWARTSVSSVSASPSRFRGAGAASSTDSLDTLSNGPEGCVVAAAAARSEKEQLQALNDRFAGYIDKVRQLEAHNRSLEGEAAALRQQQAGRAAMGELYEREVREMRGAVLRLGAARGQLRLEQEHLLEDIAHVRQRLDEEARQREEAEAAARALARFAQEAEAARVELQKKAQALQEECGYLRRHHQEEVGELLGQIQGCGAAQAQAHAEARDALKCDVTSALREIRAQLEGHAVQSTLQSEEWFRGARARGLGGGRSPPLPRASEQQMVHQGVLPKAAECMQPHKVAVLLWLSLGASQPWIFL